MILILFVNISTYIFKKNKGSLKINNNSKNNQETLKYMCDIANHFRFSFSIHYATLSYYWLKIKLVIFTEKSLKVAQ